MPREVEKKKTARREILIATGIYLAIIYVSQWVLWFLKQGPEWAKVLVALTPMMGLATILRAVVRAHRASDELQRRIDAEAAIVSAVLVGLGSFAAGLALAAADPNPRIHGIYVLVIGPALMGTWGLAKSWLERRYRPPVERVV